METKECQVCGYERITKAIDGIDVCALHVSEEEWENGKVMRVTDKKEIVKTYRVRCWKMEYGYYKIRAENEERAKGVANIKLFMEDEFDEVDGTHMEYGVGDVERIVELPS
jgi:hypothetical protein